MALKAARSYESEEIHVKPVKGVFHPLFVHMQSEHPGCQQIAIQSYRLWSKYWPYESK